MVIYMKVTDDKYEFPLHMAETVKELANICGVTESCIRSAICREKYHKINSCYKKVEVEDE